VKLKAKARKHLRLACVVVDVSGSVYLERRDSGGLFGGLWEPITAIVDDADDVEAVWSTLCIERGIAPPSRFSAPIVVERTLTHRELRFEVTLVSSPSSPQRASAVADSGLFDDDALLTVGLSSAVRAVLTAARSPRLL
jgi:adenine-specific DNA glycosylase